MFWFIKGFSVECFLDLKAITFHKVQTISAKVKSYLACGKPVFELIDREASLIIQESSVGMMCSTENQQERVNNIIRMKEMLNDGTIDMGKNARKYYD